MKMKRKQNERSGSTQKITKKKVVDDWIKLEISNVQVSLVIHIALLKLGEKLYKKKKAKKSVEIGKSEEQNRWKEKRNQMIK